MGISTSGPSSRRRPTRQLVAPVVQRERFAAQALLAAAGDDEAMPLDEDFLGAMEYGMQPSWGMGMGIDRLLMAHRFGYP